MMAIFHFSVRHSALSIMIKNNFAHKYVEILKKYQSWLEYIKHLYPGVCNLLMWGCFTYLCMLCTQLVFILAHTHTHAVYGCAALPPPAGESRYQPLLRGALAQLKMATGVLQRVRGGLGRAKSGAHSAGQLVLWGRWGRSSL